MPEEGWDQTSIELFLLEVHFNFGLFLLLFSPPLIFFFLPSGLTVT
jgi:hypothetical protein